MARSDGIHDSVLELIGGTPLVRLGRLAGPHQAGGAEILAKLEFYNPGGSVKDRTGLAMIEAAEEQGALKPGYTLVEPTYGNTGIGLAIAARLKGYRLVCTVPDRLSPEKIDLLKAYGAKVIPCPSDLPPEHPGHYRQVAARIAAETPDAFMPNQYFNEANPLIHYRTTGPEIWRQTGGRADVLVAGLGTGGTIVGAGRFLRERNPDVKLVGVDPKGSRYRAEFAGAGPAAEVRPYLLEGVGQDFIPGTLDLGLLHEVIEVEDKEAFAMARRLALEEGILAGGSAGAAICAALRIAAGWGRGLRIVAVLPDDGRNYLSRIYSDEWMRGQGFLEGPRKGAAIRDILASKPFRFRQLQSLHPGDPVRKAIALLMANDISQLPVIADGVPVGCVTEAGLAGKLTESEADGRGEGAAFGERKVAEVMGHPLPTLQLDAVLGSPLGFFSEQRAALVLDGEAPYGILTLSDVVQHLLKT